MVEQEEPGRDLAGLVVPLAGPAGRYRGPVGALPAGRCGRGEPSVPAGAYFGHLAGGGAGGADRPFVWHGPAALVPVLVGVGVAWDRAVRSEARDFCRWLQVAGKPVAAALARAEPGRGSVRRSRWRARLYAPSVRAHSETVLRSFYDFHLEAGTGPLVNPFPLDRSRRGGRAHAHRNPMEPYRLERSGMYRPAVPSRIPRSVPDEEFNEIFAALHSHRDRALVAFYVSTGARASELLSATRGGADPGRQLITVVRKGTRELQQLPASTDAFVWLRLYQLEMEGKLPRGSGQPLWWTLRRPFRPLTYHAAHRMFERAGRGGGHGRDAAFAASYRGLPDGRGSGPAAHRRAAGAGPCAADDHAAVSDAAQGGRDPPDTGPPRRAGPSGPAAGPAGPGAGLPAREPGCAVRERVVVTGRGGRAARAGVGVAGGLPGRADPFPAAAAGRGLAGQHAGPRAGARASGRPAARAGRCAGGCCWTGCRARTAAAGSSAGWPAAPRPPGLRGGSCCPAAG